VNSKNVRSTPSKIVHSEPDHSRYKSDGKLLIVLCRMH
jgi:hypothetical protein